MKLLSFIRSLFNRPVKLRSLVDPRKFVNLSSPNEEIIISYSEFQKIPSKTVIICKKLSVVCFPEDIVSYRTLGTGIIIVGDLELSGIGEIYLPDSLTIFGNLVIGSSIKLQEMTLPDNLAVSKSIFCKGNSAFSSNRIPDSTIIGKSIYIGMSEMRLPGVGVGYVITKRASLMKNPSLRYKPWCKIGDIISFNVPYIHDSTWNKYLVSILKENHTKGSRHFFKVRSLAFPYLPPLYVINDDVYVSYSTESWEDALDLLKYCTPFNIGPIPEDLSENYINSLWSSKDSMTVEEGLRLFRSVTGIDVSTLRRAVKESHLDVFYKTITLDDMVNEFGKRGREFMLVYVQRFKDFIKTKKEGRD